MSTADLIALIPTGVHQDLYQDIALALLTARPKTTTDAEAVIVKATYKYQRTLQTIRRTSQQFSGDGKLLSGKGKGSEGTPLPSDRRCSGRPMHTPVLGPRSRLAEVLDAISAEHRSVLMTRLRCNSVRETAALLCLTERQTYRLLAAAIREAKAKNDECQL